jgi:hypothetical protein
MFSNLSLPPTPAFTAQATFMAAAVRLDGHGDVFFVSPFLLSSPHTATTLAEQLSDDVAALPLSTGLSTSLLSVLNHAIGLIDDSNPDNDDVAVNNIEAFMHIVNAQYGKKISPAEGDYLLMLAKCLIHQVQRPC